MHIWNKIDPYCNHFYIYMQLLFKIEWTIVFLLWSKLISSLLMVVLIMNQTTILFIQIRQKDKLPFQRIFDRVATLFANIIMLLIVMLISFENVSSSLIRFKIIYSLLEVQKLKTTTQHQMRLQLIQFWLCWWQQLEFAFY